VGGRGSEERFRPAAFISNRPPAHQTTPHPKPHDPPRIGALRRQITQQVRKLRLDAVRDALDYVRDAHDRPRAGQLGLAGAGAPARAMLLLLLLRHLSCALPCSSGGLGGPARLPKRLSGLLLPSDVRPGGFDGMELV
jgi:hypothetical protein